MDEGCQEERGAALSCLNISHSVCKSFPCSEEESNAVRPPEVLSGDVQEEQEQLLPVLASLVGISPEQAGLWAKGRLWLGQEAHAWDS